MARYIEIEVESDFPASVNGNKLNFGVDTQNRACLTNSNGITYNFGTGQTTANFPTYDSIELTDIVYSIKLPGIYRITDIKGAGVRFPSPVNFVGQTIIIINSDEGASITLTVTDPDTRPVGDLNTRYEALSKSRIYTFYSMGDVWRGTGTQFIS